MARPHTCFIQAQAMPWRKGLYCGGRPDVRSKVLSVDKQKGDSTCLLQYPAKYRRRGKEFVDSNFSEAQLIAAWDEVFKSVAT